MAPPSKSSRTRKTNEDLISNLLVVVIDKILQLLPLFECAKMSVLSKQWRNNWSSISSLRFDENFWMSWADEDGCLDWERFSSILSNIFIPHQGPIHEVVFLDIPEFDTNIEYEEITAFLSRLLSFLSRNCVKRFALYHFVYGNTLCLPFNMFFCMELEELVLSCITVNNPPVEFKGFLHLKKLHLDHMIFKHDIVGSLIASCPKLATLMVKDCTCVNQLIIDAPMLENCTLIGLIGFIAFKKVPNLAALELSLSKRNSLSCVDVANAIKNVARSCELESLSLGLHSIQLMTTATIGQRKSRPFAFSDLKKLSLPDLNLHDHDVFFFTFGLIQSCTSLIKLNILVMSSTNMDQYLVDFNPDYTFLYLRFATVKIVRCCKPVLNLIEILLACSPVLEKLMVFPIKELKLSSHAKMLVQLNRFRRVSPKVEVICPVSRTVASPSSSE